MDCEVRVSRKKKDPLIGMRGPVLGKA